MTVWEIHMHLKIIYKNIMGKRTILKNPATSNVDRGEIQFLGHSITHNYSSYDTAAEDLMYDLQPLDNSSQLVNITTPVQVIVDGSFIYDKVDTAFEQDLLIGGTKATQNLILTSYEEANDSELKELANTVVEGAYLVVEEIQKDNVDGSTPDIADQVGPDTDKEETSTQYTKQGQSNLVPVLDD